MFRKGGQSTAINAGGRRKVHTTFNDGSELVEEYDLSNGELVVRKKRAKSAIGPSGWLYLYGDSYEKPAGGAVDLVESAANPSLSRKDTRTALQWRIRNLPYPLDVYKLTIEERQIVVRTTNKKYFKKIEVPELDLLQLPLDPNLLTWAHAHNTLVLSYEKPDELLEAEQEDMQDLRRMHAQEDGNVDCKQQ